MMASCADGAAAGAADVVVGGASPVAAAAAGLFFFENAFVSDDDTSVIISESKDGFTPPVASCGLASGPAWAEVTTPGPAGSLIVGPLHTE